MARRKRIVPDIPVEALTFDMDQVMSAEQSTEAPSAPEDVIDAIASVADGISPDGAEQVPEEPSVPPEGSAEPEHKSIRNWEAFYWKSRPMWKHKRTGQTLHKRDEVWRLRNLK